MKNQLKLFAGNVIVAVDDEDSFGNPIGNILGSYRW